MELHDCNPTMSDTQILEFCKKGYLMLEGVVGDDINRRTVEYLEGRGNEPSEILEQDWFMENVILQPEAAGAVRSLLGRDFGLPVLVSNHQVTCPLPRQRWHRDGNSPHGPALKYLQVFYYPQDVPREMGPTEVLPGSHFLYMPPDYMSHYGGIRGSVYTTAPAGTIFLTVYSIWHRRSESTGSGVRNNLKYNYFRTALPERDWVREEGFDFATADYEFGESLTYRQTARDTIDNAEMFCWLCGKSEQFRVLGGQGWPVPNSHALIALPYGVPEGLDQ